jgi:exodeoxyribonuclease V beta subunit
MSEPMRLHRPDAALRRGVTLIEASAGTGKTYNLASLFVRLVAEEDVPVDRILVVTFTEAATLELRTRLRRRLDEALEVVRGGGDEGDVGLAPLAVGDDATLAARSSSRTVSGSASWSAIAR